MPDSNLTDGSVFTSSFYNTYIREQVVVTCTSGTRPTGVEGRTIYETDTDRMLVYNGSAWTVVAGQMTAWSPTITQSASVSGTVNRGWYVRHANGMFTARLRWTASGAGTASNAITISMPVTLSDAQDIGGGGVFNDGGTVYTVATWPNTTSACYLVRDGATSVLGLSSPTIASSDVIDVTITGRYA